DNLHNYILAITLCSSMIKINGDKISCIDQVHSICISKLINFINKLSHIDIFKDSLSNSIIISQMNCKEFFNIIHNNKIHDINFIIISNFIQYNKHKIIHSQIDILLNHIRNLLIVPNIFNKIDNN